MIQTLLGSKLRMTQEYKDSQRIAATEVEVGPCVVTQIKSRDKNGYWALQLGFNTKRLKNTTKSLQGHLRGVIKEKNAPRFLCEVRTKEEPVNAQNEPFKVGDVVSIADIFSPDDTVQVTGVSKGKGFAGGVKRWGFSGGPKTHGQSDRHRAPGSIGQGTTPGRVYKGKKMAGRMGGEKKTIKNLKVVSIDSEKNTMRISGGLPGTVGSLLVIKKI